MTIDEVRKRLADILNKENQGAGEGDSGSSYIDDNKAQDAQDAAEVRDNKRDRLNIHKVEDYHAIFGGDIVNGYLLNTRQMTRKEYLSCIRGLRQEEVLGHPLLYCMFRSEDQGEANFFDWLSRFKK